MATRAKTPSYIVELELKLTTKEKHIIDKRLKLAIILYNMALSKCIKRLKALKADKEYRSLIKEKQENRDTQRKKEISKRLRKIEEKYGYSITQIQQYVNKGYKHYDGINLGSAIVQKIAKRAFEAVDKVKYAKSRKLYFKPKDLEEFSIENKENGVNITFRDGKLVWAKLPLECKINPKNQYLMEALKSKTKYCRIIRKRIRRKVRYFVQLIQEGYPPKKNRIIGNDTTVGLDIGPSTIAIVSNDYVNLLSLSNQKLDNYKKQIRKIQRAMDRSRRSTNSQNYNEDGTIKKGPKKWNYSNNYMRLKYKLNKIHRKLRINRNITHEKLANLILSFGTDIRVEKLSIAGWAKRSKNITKNKKNGKTNNKKRFGKSIASNAPASLLLKIDRKLQYEGEKLKKINTAKCKASQYNHKTDTFKKKALNERIAIVGEEIIQRDIYSAFLIKNTVDTLDKIDKIKCDSEWNRFLENYKVYLKA